MNPIDTIDQLLEGLRTTRNPRVLQHILQSKIGSQRLWENPAAAQVCGASGDIQLFDMLEAQFIKHKKFNPSLLDQSFYPPLMIAALEHEHTGLVKHVVLNPPKERQVAVCTLALTNSVMGYQKPLFDAVCQLLIERSDHFVALGEQSAKVTDHYQKIKEAFDRASPTTTLDVCLALTQKLYSCAHQLQFYAKVHDFVAMPSSPVVGQPLRSIPLLDLLDQWASTKPACADAITLMAQAFDKIDYSFPYVKAALTKSALVSSVTPKSLAVNPVKKM